MIRSLKNIDNKCEQLHLVRTLLQSNNFVDLYLRSTDSELSDNAKSGPKFAVEFSSPNIAKPFHVGHLRSTFLGRFLSNILQSNGASVTKINYLGDWGNQFGLLAAGFEIFGSEEKLRTTKIMHLYEVYVKANKLAETDPSFATKAANFFADMEKSQSEALRFWKTCKEMSVVELKEFYAKLNVNFDLWQYESDYCEKSKQLINDLLKTNVIEQLDNGLVGVKVVDDLVHPTKDFRFIPLTKSDSTTLYLTRDVVAAIERVDLMNFDHIYYVVDVEQRNHFINLQAVLNHMGRSDVASKISHVRFGLIKDMSTRQGKTVFVSDMLQKGEEIAFNVLKSSPTTKLPEDEFHNATLQLALSAFIVNDMKRSRLKGYNYDWEKLLTNLGDSGYFLQLCHARLCSLEEKSSHCLSSVDSMKKFTFENVFAEPEAEALFSHITEKLQKTLILSLQELEPVYLVGYLFRLGHLSNAAHKKLRVVDSEEHVRNSRLLLFSTARMLLAYCMQILGLKPLNKV